MAEAALEPAATANLGLAPLAAAELEAAVEAAAADWLFTLEAAFAPTDWAEAGLAPVATALLEATADADAMLLACALAEADSAAALACSTVSVEVALALSMAEEYRELCSAGAMCEDEATTWAEETADSTSLEDSSLLNGVLPWSATKVLPASWKGLVGVAEAWGQVVQVEVMVSKTWDAAGAVGCAVGTTMMWGHVEQTEVTVRTLLAPVTLLATVEVGQL